MGRLFLDADQAFGFFDLKPASLDLFDEFDLSFSRDLRDGVQLPPRQGLILTGALLHLGSEREQGEQFRDFSLRFTHQLREIILRILVGVADRSQCIGDFEGTQVGSLPVLNYLSNDDFIFARVLNPTGDFGQFGAQGGVISAFAGNDLINLLAFDIADRDWLHDAELPDGLIDPMLFFRIEVAPRLRRIGMNATNLDKVGATQSAASVQCLGTCHGFLLKQRRRARGERSVCGADRLGH